MVDERCGRSIATIPTGEKGNSLSFGFSKLTCDQYDKNDSRIEYQSSYETRLSFLTTFISQRAE